MRLQIPGFIKTRRGMLVLPIEPAREAIDGFGSRRRHTLGSESLACVGTFSARNPLIVVLVCDDPISKGADRDLGHDLQSG